MLQDMATAGGWVLAAVGLLAAGLLWLQLRRR